MSLKSTLVAASLCAATMTGVASAGILQLDINALSGQSFGAAGGPGAFGGVGHTGSVHLSSNANSAFVELLLDGVSQNIASGQLQSFSGVINLVGGGVVGGNLSMTLVGGATFNAQIQNGFGQVNTQAGQGFRIDGLLTGATFSSDPFAGVPITPWFSAQPLEGAFLNFSFSPNANGLDMDTDIDIYLIPAPHAGVALGLAAMGLGARRRRS